MWILCFIKYIQIRVAKLHNVINEPVPKVVYEVPWPFISNGGRGYVQKVLLYDSKGDQWMG